MLKTTMDLVGYSDRLSAVSGESIAFKVSSRLESPFAARLVRVIHADVNPAGPGLRMVDLGHIYSTSAPSVEQLIHRGSWIHVPGVPWPNPVDNWSVSVRVLPTLAKSGSQCIMSQWDSDKTKGWQIGIGGDGATATWSDDSGSTVNLRANCPVGARWSDVSLCFDARTRTLKLSFTPIDSRYVGAEAQAVVSADGWRGPAPAVAIATLSADAPKLHFNGRIEAPRIYAGAIVIAAWDFSVGIDTADIFDRGPSARHGRIVNLPTRAVRSSNWAGREFCWRAAPDEYAAIHFHQEDIDDVNWETSFTFTVPDDLPSGSYAMALADDRGVDRDWVPFWVSARPGRPGHALAIVIPTYTYQAYANFARGNFDEEFRAKVNAWQAYPHNPDDHPEVGLSTYNLHADGSGVAFSTRLRPMLTMRPGFMTFNEPRGSGCRHYIADHYLLDWLEREGIGFDIVTDDDLERHGAAILEPYRAVLTSTHPEYHTERTLDAIEGYLKQGGNLAYLGGNGFYWKIAVSDLFPGALELRRGNNGIRNWTSLPGELHNAFDGRLGGLWRDSGRPPQRLVGIGFSAQGPFEGSYYRVHDDAREQPGGWLLDGVPSGIIGDYGLSGGGAAGFELDSMSTIAGSPEQYTLLATSEGHSAAFGAALDALTAHDESLDHGPLASLIKAEMIWYETGWGGSVFSVGSITWCGSLSHNKYCNDVAKIMKNYAMRMTRRDA
ncbi:N,N-dimethylformamidase beta subunit family domain-containing protein [Paraburkholderia sp. BL10I2N1]|uniref:N,N-dimethylformamidase beta subunit family domain-containing protein n=1 Tax=Paraburkholderia sp. BL10I2N1 TaxID=1938796 RepID=UPI00105BD8BB|nr:N,N-dimethylformamidase beta subunit family domain-containing protein [Paraburkholderia sp. BL10I2N1]TDN63101.1 N,N-dimethylformamidase [Paraburkholderia sp. BL10I2N1]